MKQLKVALTALLLLVGTLAIDGRVAEWGAADSLGVDSKTNEIPHAAEPTVILQAIQRSFDFDNVKKVSEYEPITIVAFGDMMLDRYVRTLMERNGLDYPFQHFYELLDEMLYDENGNDLGPADFLFANLEGPISDSDYVNNGVAMRFNFRPDVVPILEAYGFNLLSLANNHAFDMGEVGAIQTRQYLTSAGIHHFGYAEGIRDESVWTTELNGTTLSFVGFNDTTTSHLDYDTATELIRSLENDSDFTIVSIHWGNEYWLEPTDSQVDNAHAFIDAGADVILGHHPHVIQPIELYNGPDGAPRPIYYSLGNFIFDQYFRQNVQEGLGVTLVLQKSAESGQPNRITTQEIEFDILQSQPQPR